jgi:hypothetical protein
MHVPLRHVVWLTLLAFSLTSQLSADDTSPIASVEYSVRKKQGPTREEELQAEKELKAELVRKYIASLGPERKPLVEGRRTQLLANPDDLLENYTVRNRQFDRNSRRAMISAQADINVARVSALIDGTSPGQSPAVQANGEKNPIVFIFAARRQARVETKAARLITGREQSTVVEAEAVVRASDGISASSSASTQRSTVTSASSVVRTADQISYVVEPHLTAQIDRTMSKVFVDRQFDAVSAAALVEATEGRFNPDDLEKDFESRSEFTMEHQRQATKAVRDAGAGFLAYGTLTIGVQRLDPANPERTIVSVIVDAQVLDCRRPLTVKVASIGALHVEGTGRDQTQAEVNGLELAAERAANVLADQLRQRGVR